MAMATGRDVLMQLLQEVEDLRQQGVAANERVDRQFQVVEEQFQGLAAEFSRLAAAFSQTNKDMGGLAQAFRSTRELHEKHLARIGRTLNKLADEVLEDRGRFEDHLRRGHDPQPA
ncbi:hypothetical protein [Pyxidicoccus xibeiensis]|uniref:hypothetical protein n=1 Tax=Pyxidicoccus xibeiensis TaxID=2906759 RepID=UPI0020A73D41|nr:hypothetical protein [Pyxidicoccus xibeiensis]MCP3137124.1 hypothetical protein [Pyxidicoccus xibeiensis]